MSDNDATIYVVDDDEIVLLSVRAILEGHYEQVSGYSTAEQFLEEADLAQPGCLITDLQMPGIDGVELQGMLARLGSPISVIVVTGGVDPATATQLLEGGTVKLLEKPYSPSDLLAAVALGLTMSGERARMPKNGK